jgi:hypothetical protein
MGNLAGDVLQVVSPRAADDDGVIQREGTAKKLSGRIPVRSARLRAQPAILHYRMRRPPALVAARLPAPRSFNRSAVGENSIVARRHARSIWSLCLICR